MPFLMMASDWGGDGTIFVVGGVVAVLGIIGATIKNVTRTRAREETRREIAAYIAEGSMTPEQGERLMASGDMPGKT